MPVDISLHDDHAPAAVARRSQRHAWLSLALVPVGFVVSMIVGEFLLGLQGYESGAEELPPLAPRVLAGIPATLLGIAPAVAAARFGLRARRHGHPRGATPAVLGGLLAVLFIALNLLASIFTG